jgi:SynChlorMet cassette radical SAM/SPASM protein ScmE
MDLSMRYPEAYPGVMTVPKTIDISLTGKCNLKCRYCFYNDSMEKASDLPTETWLSFFRELGAIGVRKLCLSGGEPFIRKDFFELIDGIIENKMRYNILTNGTLVDEKVITKFAKGKRRLRLDSIQVSIDGSKAEIHDQSRPPKSFDKALSALKLLKAHNFPVNVRVTINRHNVDDLDNIATLLIDEVGLKGFSTNEADYQGSARCQGQDIILTVDERKRAMTSLVNINRQFDGRIGAQAGPLSRIKMMTEITEKIARGEKGMPGRGTLCSCGGVFSKMAVLHDGTFVPCNMLPDLVMGRIGEITLEEAWQTHPNINKVRERRKIPISELEECHDCPYSGFCSGGCPGTVMAKTGKLNGIDPLSCYKIYLEEMAQ